MTDTFEFARKVRGEGLVWGLEMENDKMANQAVLACYHQGLHLMGPLAGNVLRIAPPLIIQPTEAEEGIKRIEKAFRRFSPNQAT